MILKKDSYLCRRNNERTSPRKRVADYYATKYLDFGRYGEMGK